MMGLVWNLAYVLAMIVAGYAILFACLGRAAKRELGFKPAIIFAALAAMVFLSPSIWLVHAAFFLTVPLIARGRAEVGLVYIVALLSTPEFEKHISAGGTWLLALSSHGILALGALAALAFKGGPHMRRPPASDLAAISILLLLLVISVRDTSMTSFLRQSTVLLMTVAIPYYVVTRSLRTPEDIRKLLLWLTGACAMLSAIAIFEALRHWPLYSDSGRAMGVRSGGMFLMRSGLVRATGPLGNSISMGFILVIGLSAVLLSRPFFRSKAAHLWIVTLLGAGLLAPLARSAWLGAAVALPALTLYRASRGGSTRLLLPGAFAGLFAYVAISFGSGADTAGTVNYRERLLTRGIEEFWESPLIGDSYNGVVTRMRDLVQGQHIVDFVNSYLYFALMTGAVGLAVFVTSLLLPAVKLWQARHSFQPNAVERDLGAFCFATILASAAMFAFTSFFGRPVIMLLFACGLAAVITREGRQARKRSRTDAETIEKGSSVDDGLERPARA